MPRKKKTDAEILKESNENVQAARETLKEVSIADVMDGLICVDMKLNTLINILASIKQSVDDADAVKSGKNEVVGSAT